MVSVDMDGTVADISKRREYALRFGADGSVDFFSVLLNGQHYHMDEPILAAREFLLRYASDMKGSIVYLSGRRQGTELQSKKWLDDHGFPPGEIVHRRTGHRSLQFKIDWLHKFCQRGWVDAHIGDRLEDDGGAARSAGVRFVHIVDNVWPTFDELKTRFSPRDQ